MSRIDARHGAFGLVPPELDGSVVSQDFPTFSINSEVVESSYLEWLTRCDWFADICSRSSLGTTNRIRLSDDIFLAQPIPLPPLDEQRRIVDLLSRAAGIRRLREQALAKARAVVPALFLDMFGDPATNPKGWPVEELGTIIDGFEGGKNLQAGDEGSSPYRILKISAVTSGRFRPSECKPAPAGHVPPIDHFVKVGDLLITRANTADLVGAVAFVDKTPPNILLPDKIWRFVWLPTSPVLAAFVLSAFQTSAIRTELAKMATGTSDSMRNISQAKLLRLNLALPPLDLQHRFALHLADLRSVVARQERALAAARELERALMARLLG